MFQRTESPLSENFGSGSAKRQEVAACVATIGVSLLLWFSPYLVSGDTFVLSETSTNYVDFGMARKLLVQTSGTAEWNPYILFGVNWVGREAFMNPLKLSTFLGYLIRDDKTAYVLVTIAAFASMGIAMYVFLRALNIRPSFARIGMVIYLLAPKWTDDGYHGPMFVVGYAFTPVAMLVVLRMYEAKFRHFAHFLVLGVLFSLIYLSIGASFFIMQAYLIIPFFFYNLYLGWREYGNADRMLLLRTLGGVGLLGLLALALSAYILIPFWQNFLGSERSLFTPDYGWRIADYAGLVFPWLNRLYGDGVFDLKYPAVALIFDQTYGLYTGILAIPVLLRGFAQRLWTPMSLFFAAAFIAWLVLWNSFFIKVFPLMPLLDQLSGGNPSKGFGHIIVIFSMSVVLPSILQQIQDRGDEGGVQRAGKWLRWLNRGLIAFYLLAAVVFVAGALVIGTSLKMYFWSRVTIGQFLVLHYYFQEMVLIFLGSFLIRAVIVWVYDRRSFIRGWRSTALLMLLVADFQLIFVVNYPFTDLDLRYDISAMPNSFIQNTNLLDRIGASNYQLYGWSNRDRLNNLIGMQAPIAYAEVVERFGKIFYRGHKLPNYEPSLNYFPLLAGRSFFGFHESILPKYFWDFERALNGSGPHYWRQSWLGLWDPHSKLLDVAGIKFVFWHEAIADPRFSEVARYALDSHVYLNKKAVPRVYLVSRVEYYDSSAILLARMQANSFNPREVVTTEDPLLVKAIPAEAMVGAAGDAYIQEYSPNRIVIRSQSRQSSVLVLNDMFYPNWTARVDGVDSTIYRVNGIFRGVVVPSGSAKIEFLYADSAFHAGVAISSASWGCVAFLMLWMFWRSRKQSADFVAPPRQVVA